MQGQRTGVESLPDILEFDHAPGPRSSSIEQDAFWNNMLIDPIETRNIPSYIVPPNNSTMPYVNAAAEESLALNLWNSGGSCSSGQSYSHNSHDETKMGHGWSSSVTISVGEQRAAEGRREAANMLSLGIMNLNNNNYDVPQSSYHSNYGKARMSTQVRETGLCLPCGSGLLQREDIPSSSGSSSIFDSSSGNGGLCLEDGDVRLEGSHNARRLSCKRKNIEGFPGQSSASGNATFFQSGEHSTSQTPASNTGISRSSGRHLCLLPPEEQLNTGVSSASRGVLKSDYEPSINVSGSAESSNRNFRMRINPTRQHEITSLNIWAPGSSSGHSNLWGASQQYSPFVPFNHSVGSSPMVAGSISYPQPPLPVMPGLPENVQTLPWNGGFRSSVGSSSSSSVPAAENSSVSRGMLINNISEHALYVPAVEMRPPVDQRGLNLPSENINVGGILDTPLQATPSSNTAFHPSLGTTWAPQQNFLSRHRQRASELARRSLFPSSSSEFGGQSSNFALHQPNHSSSIEIGRQPGVGQHNQHQNALRLGAAMHRQNDSAQGPPLPFRTLAGRRRILSEHIRNALSIMRRGDNLRFEDVFLFDRAVFLGAADLHDRHRDMRLDVDNMSYEELLALEERIGNVNTGLNEEKIMKSLKQHNCSSPTGEASQEVEPCCICQEEYAKGDEMGKLDCGHDFHTACIKQWLMQKNLCPICKETALSS